MNESELNMKPKHLTIETEGAVTIVTLARENIRNAINEAMLQEIEDVFRKPPAGTRSFVLAAKGAHFCAGLDLREHYDKNRTPLEFMALSQAWHRVFDLIQFSGIPVIAALQGAVVGGLTLGIVESMAVQFIPGTFGGSPWKDVWAFVLLIVVLVFRPQGILGAKVVDRA